MRIDVDDRLTLYARDESDDALAQLDSLASELDPEILAVEMDRKRYEPKYNKYEWERRPLTRDMFSKERFFSLMAQLFYLSVEQRIMTDEERWENEYTKAIDLARERGKELAFADRPIDLTLKRAWYAMTPREKLRMSWHVRKELLSVSGKPEQEADAEPHGNGKDVMAVITGEVGSISPKTERVLVDERETYMAERLAQMRERGRTLAVLSPYHIGPVAKKVGGGERTDLKELERLPETMKVRRYYWAIPIVFVSFLIYSLYDESQLEIVNLISWWILATSVLSTVGAIIARAHWKTILSVMLLAPFFSFILIGSGWIGGLVELWVNKPRVRDIQALGHLEGWRDLLTNRAIKPLIVGLSVNGGNLLGIIFVLPYIIRLGLS